MSEVNQYIIGKGEVPSWLKSQAQKGRFKFLYGDNSEIIGGMIYSATGATVVSVGDVVVLGKAGLSIMPKKEKVYAKKNDYKGVQ